jgi:hypothetical protein
MSWQDKPLLFENLTCLIIMIIMLVCEHWLPYYISYVSWQVSRHLIWQDVNFWFPSYFLHVLTGHSFKNLTWPIFTIIMLACEHCLPWCISYVSWQVSKMMTWQGVNFGCPDVFPMCHDMSAKWWHGRVWTLAALMYFLCVLTGQQNDDMAGCELWLPSFFYVSWGVTTFKKIWHGRSSRLSR